MILRNIKILGFLLLTPFSLISPSRAETRTIDVINVDGVISPVISEYIISAIDRAEKNDSVCLIIKMDTPGGLDKSMREIIKRMLSSRVPIVVYVAPEGARAASAGTYITLASHIAVMAPSTSIGAATPVSLGMGGTEDPAMMRKVTNDAVSYIEGIAKMRNRDVKWAREAVISGASITADKALDRGVIDLIATDDIDLIAKLDGREVNIDGEIVTLHTIGVPIKEVKMGFRTRFLAVISDPNIAYILLILGFYGLFFEFSNPGSILPGIAGVILLIMAFYSLHTLPVNYAGVFLILFGLVLFIAEVKVTSHGALTIGGVISMVLGSILLIHSPAPYLKLSWYVISPTVIMTALFFTFIVTMGIRAQFKKHATGPEALIDAIGETRTDITKESGKVFIHGEIWNAVSDKIIKSGIKVKVVRKKGMVLSVEKLEVKKLKKD
jgi:membrane-bound serine protease (ClpP class)